MSSKSNIIFGTVIAIAVVGQAIAFECPPKNLIRPCTCADEGNRILKCRGISTSDILDSVFRLTRDTRIGYFELLYSALNHIPASSLIMNIESINVTSSNLATLFDKDLDDSNILRNLSLSDVRFIDRSDVRFKDRFSWEQLHNLKRLEVLSLNKIKVRSLNEAFTSNVNKNLSSLSMLRTMIWRLEDGVFAEFHKLVVIHFDYSYVSAWKRNFFPRPAIIKSLSFRGNRIQNLPDDLFDDMPQLESINLRDNKIIVVVVRVFGRVYDQLHTLDLSANPIMCTYGILQLTARGDSDKVLGICKIPLQAIYRNLSLLEVNDFHTSSSRLVCGNGAICIYF